MHPEQTMIIEGNLLIEGGRRAFEQLIHTSPRPTAAFTNKDLTSFVNIWAA